MMQQHPLEAQEPSDRVWFIQPYVPKYRVALFDALHKGGLERQLDIRVLAGRPYGETAGRGDQVVSAEWLEQVDVRTFSAPGGRTLRLPRIGGHIRQGDVVVVELGTLNLSSWHMLARRGVKTVAWGHGGAFVQQGSLIRTCVESSMARMADHVMTYTYTGKKMMQSAGVPAARVTAVGNSTDTDGLAALASTTRPAAEEPHTRRYLYVGGLDEDKRIGFLMRAIAEAHAADPRIRLTMYGSGDLRNEVERVAANSPCIEYRGRAAADDLVRESGRCHAIAMPGRVGLVAVDGLALRLPLVTTTFDFHAPEMEYLTEGLTVHTSSNDLAHYARELVRVASLPRVDEVPQWHPTIDWVAGNMLDVLHAVRLMKG